jgi:hypothetical protein
MNEIPQQQGVIAMKFNKPSINEILFHLLFTSLFFGMIFLRGAETMISVRFVVTYTLALGLAFVCSRFVDHNQTVMALDNDSNP